MVADTGVGNCRGEDVGLGLEILGHESAVGSADTSDLLRVDPRVFSRESLDCFDNVVGYPFACSVDVS